MRRNHANYLTSQRNVSPHNAMSHLTTHYHTSLTHYHTSQRIISTHYLTSQRILYTHPPLHPSLNQGCCFSSSSTTTSDGTELVSLPSSSSPPVPIPSTHCIDCTCKYADGVNTLTSSLNTGTVNKDKKDKETEQTINWSIAGLDFVLDQDKVRRGL